MKDAIDKRNEIQRIAKSIVKRGCVKYITIEEAERRRREEEDESRKLKKLEEEHKKAQEILERLEDEAREDEELKEREVRELMEHQDDGGMTEHGSYGTSPMDDVTQDRVEAILSAKRRKIEELFQEAADLEKNLENQNLGKSVLEESQADYAKAEKDIVSEAEGTEHTEDNEENSE